MAPPVTRVGDNCTGHPCFGAVPVSTGSPDTFTNGKANARKGDPYASHCCGPVCHSGKLAVGSSTVFINNKPSGRQGDYKTCSIIDCADVHSPDTYHGG